MKFRRSLSLLLTIAMLFAFATPFASATDSANTVPTVIVESKAEIAGAIVNIAVEIENNPGILGATLKFTFDDALTLVDAQAGDAFSALTMTKPGKYTSPCKFAWDGQELRAGDIKDGTILTLQFKIPDDAEGGEEYTIDVSYASGDIFDANVMPIEIATVDGVISVIDYIPGDLNSDGSVNTGDVIHLRRHVVGGYEQNINEAAGDVDSNGVHNTGDVIIIRRYIVGGYGVVPKPSISQCNHTMTGIAYKAPTCEDDGNIAYWYCTKCNKYYGDMTGNTAIKREDTIVVATGHTEVIDKGVEPTYDSDGLTEGKHCSACNEVIVAQVVIPRLEKDEYNITYEVANGEEYIDSISVFNPNPAKYAAQDGLELQDLSVPGYYFLGWYTSAVGGTQVTEYPVGTTGNKKLYAHWQPQEYTIQFACDMVPQAKQEYTTNMGAALPRPTMDKYEFLGWSDKDGNFWKNEIPVGVTGHKTLYANWASNRNRAIAYDKLADPIIAEDSENGVMLFAYEIGKIQKIPLYTTLKLASANGIITTVEVSKQTSVSKEDAISVAETVSKETTDSSTWTLENTWSDSTQVSESYLNETGMERETAETLAKNESNSYNLVNSSGGSQTLVNSNSSYYKESENQAKSDSYWTEEGQDFALSVDTKFTNETSAKLTSKISAGVEASIAPGVKANAGAEVGTELATKNTFEIGAGVDYSNYAKNGTSGTKDWSKSVDSELYSSSTVTDEKNWNTTAGFQSSSSVSSTQAVSDKVTELISNTHEYAKTYVEGGSNSESNSTATTKGKLSESSSTTKYITSNMETVSTSYTSTGNTKGSYRMVKYGTAHVWAVVGYDIATKSYFTYTFNIMDENTEEDIDYSWDDSFEDYETSVIPFEIPGEVNDIVNSRIARTKGLEFDPETGMITRLTDEYDPETEIVVIPSYWSVDKGDGTYESVKVTGIAPNLFAGNEKIVAITLGNFINEIPESAFEGCTSLKSINCPHVMRIGKNAFNGCVSLSTFEIPSDVTSVGEDAFKNAPSIKAVASTKALAKSISESGAKNISLDISAIPEADVTDMALEINGGKTFELIGKDKEYKGLSVKSNAEKTIINGITFTENNAVPMAFTSGDVVLDRVTADCSGYALTLEAENTNLALNRSVNLITSTGNAVVAKNINLSQRTGEIAASLNVTGNLLVCGEITGEAYLKLSNGEIICINEDEYENYLTSHRITFDANGGVVTTESIMASNGMPIGELPRPSRDHHKFVGWYTEPDGGVKYTAETIMTVLSDITLYAHWELKDVSAWVLRSEAPEDAEIVDTKYSYTQTLYTTSSSSSLSGWSHYDTTWVWGSYGSWSDWSTTQYTSSESRDVKKETRSKWIDTSHYEARWRYYHWCSSISKINLYTYNPGGYTYHEINLSYEMPIVRYGGGGTVPQYGEYWCEHSPYWFHGGYSNDNGAYYNEVWVSSGYTEYYDVWSYRDRKKVYTYHFKKNENHESTTYPTGSDISNIKEWVQYREK